MGILTDDMKRVVRQQRMGFMATVCPDGSPNLSPKGTATVWDDDHLVFADLGSPVTIDNLGHNPACEINVVDTFLRKGYRFKGTAQVLTGGDLFDEIKTAYATGSHGIRRSGLPAKRYVLMTVTKAAQLVSPGYTPGKTETAMREEWTGYWAEVQKTNS
ncbi:MAG: pyridoxamine 5'-phosphate oxidase family protein [Chloroflexi bacterium]|nr:pyridoxamine 5'-phosphate oxidase family protein [Chloroflexota bacterium]MCI0864657.1 pyridoxamine 5'-phosphate oxidase family protein [Chloroflexota bacterium]MCI0904236.1 pyridoxamine 5'-phosphate oxidase family protein [Chloroflexota bacterium]